MGFGTRDSGLGAHTLARSRTYVAVYGALMVATAVTVGASALHLTMLATAGVALAIAATKASLVAAYFMHLKWETRIVRGAVALALFLFVALMGLVVASAADQVGTVL